MVTSHSLPLLPAGCKPRSVWSTSLPLSPTPPQRLRTKLGIQTYFAGDIVTPAFVQLSDLGSIKVSITQPGFKTDPNLFTPTLFSYPVISNTVPEDGVVEVLAR
ncbi:unnamed protein product [Ectocarpus sp. 8 AP-2014]